VITGTDLNLSLEITLFTDQLTTMSLCNYPTLALTLNYLLNYLYFTYLLITLHLFAIRVLIINIWLTSSYSFKFLCYKYIQLI